MDVLNANKYVVNGRVYRRNVPLEAAQGGGLRTTAIERFDLPDVDDDYDSDQDFEKTNVDNVGDEIVEQSTTNTKVTATPAAPAADHYGIVYNERKRAFMTEISFPEELLGRLIGTKGTTKKNIEDSTGAKIDIPKRGYAGPVGIASPSRESVERCYDRIEMIIFDGRKRLPFTHFVMFPALEPQVVNAHVKLIDSIRGSADVDEACKDPSIFMPPTKLHLTIIPLWLFGEKEIKATASILDEAVFNFGVENSGGVDVKLKGLSHFGDEDLDSVRVVYAKVVDSPKAQDLADQIASKLVTAGYGQEPRGGKVKLHLTVLNTKYLDTDDKEKQVIDATGLFKQFGHVEYGNFKVNQVHLCTMGATDANTGGYPVIHTSSI
uniref:KH domain-containing protein n=1 Tax=Panagrellus redivivus TaxID=6233 RepID=A0A7E4WDT2_PANRE